MRPKISGGSGPLLVFQLEASAAGDGLSAVPMGGWRRTGLSCGAPSNQIQLTGAGFADANHTYTLLGQTWIGPSSQTISNGGDGYWYWYTNLGVSYYKSADANFPCTLGT